ncbi:hypothetical protein [Dongia sp. agr-C8]
MTGRFRIPAMLVSLALLACGAWSPAANATTVEDFESFKSVRVPLPPGQWEVIDSIVIPNPRYPNFPMYQEILVSRAGKTIDRVVRIWVQIKKRQEDWFTPFRLCEDDGYFDSVVKENSGSRLDCWHLRPLSLGLAGDVEPGNAAIAKYGKQHGLFVPVVMLGARFARLLNSNQRYSVEYLWTPDLLLPANTPAKVWTPADWTTKAMEEPAKRAVIDALDGWAYDWYERIK